MAEYISQGVFRLTNPVKIESFAAVAGSKEGKGPLGTYFDKIVEDSHFGKDSWEKAESGEPLFYHWPPCFADHRTRDFYGCTRYSSSSTQTHKSMAHHVGHSGISMV